MNLLSYSQLKDGAIDFASIDRTQFESLFEQAIKAEQERIDGIVNNSDAPTFENTLKELETGGSSLSQLVSVFYALYGADATEPLEQAASKISELLSDHSTKIYTNKKLYERIAKVKESSEELPPEDKKLVEEYTRTFVRGGILLSDDKVDELKKLSRELSQFSLKFSQNSLKATKEYELHIEDESRLKGLSNRVKSSAASEAKERGKTGWVFTLDAPVYISVMEALEDRALREEYYRAYSTRCTQGEYSNLENIKKMVRLRQDKAVLLGYEDHSHYVLEERMAKKKQTVFNFLSDLKSQCLPAAKAEVEELKNFAASLGFSDELKPWDALFYRNKLKKKKFNFDPEELRPYFSLDNVLKGLFQVAERLYSLKLVATDKLPVYADDVLVYEVYKGETYYGLLYLDLFPRKTKRGGAWQTTFRSQGLMFSELRRPHVSIVCNFTKPSAGVPALLSFEEVETLFHEFGHGLHSLLSRCTYQTLSGTSVEWDFVELPSQIMENWASSYDVLKSFALHYETGQPIPENLVKGLKDSQNFMAGSHLLRQVSLSTLDMSWHVAEATQVEDALAFENKVMNEFQLIPAVAGSAISPTFGHIFAGGYSAGYYSYQWAEVLEADAFQVFKEQGLFNQEVASRFEESILSRGGTKDADALYKDFRGQSPSLQPLLQKYGLSQVASL